jgi:uncharacterized membrane protein
VYDLCIALDGFLRVPPSFRIETVQHLVMALQSANTGYLTINRAPPLYSSGVRYRADNGRIERQWWDIEAVLARGYGDCKALAAWRAAELTVQGYQAHAIVIPDDPKFQKFHVIVRYNGATEDPSERLGMR